MSPRTPRQSPAHRATRASSGFGPTLGLLLRSHRTMLLAWLIPLLVVVAVVIPAYRATYPEPAQREVLVEQMSDTSGTRIMYGILHAPGTLGQLFAWEMGTYVLVLGSIMAILLGISSTRAAEQSGTLELVRAGGVRPWVPAAASLVLVTTAAAVLALGSTALLLLQVPVVGSEEISASGAIAFGAIIALCAWCCGLVALCCAQLLPEAGAARSWALGFLAVAFVLRILADQAAHDDAWPSWLERLSWFTPLGWREIVGPFDEDRFARLLPLLAICLGLAAAGLWLHSRREYGAGLLPGSASTRRRLRVPTVELWAGIGARGQVIGWSITALLLATLFGSMASGLVSTLQESDRTRELWAQVVGSAAAAQPPGEAQLISEYYQFLGVFMALIIMVFAVSAVLRWRGEERAGHMDLELTAGTRRWRSLSARCLIAGIGCAVLLALCGAVMGWLGERQLAGEIETGRAMDNALTSSLGHLPGLWAAIGVAALLVALVPRLSGLAWFVVGWSGFAQLFGGLVELPQRAMDAGVLAWSFAPGDDWPWVAWGVLAAVGVLGTALAAALIGRRDIGA